MTIELHSQPGSGLADRKDYAESISCADLLPEAFRRKPANCLIAMEVADALGMRPFMVMQEMSVISGRPTFSAKFMRALVRRAGHRLRETYADGVARCVIIRKDDPEFEHVTEWDEAKARQHGYWGKGHWNKNPSLMLGNRSLAENVRAACPEVLGGVAYTPDEVEDFAPETVSQKGGRDFKGGVASALAAAKGSPASPASPTSPASAARPAPTVADVEGSDDIEHLRAMWKHADSEVRELIEARVHDLQAAENVDTETGEVLEGEVIGDDPWEEQ